MRAPAAVKDLVAKGLAQAVEVGECLEWQGRIGNKASVPVVKSREGKTYSAEYSVPRFLWEQENGPVPAGKCVYRKCCNNACVEKSHLVVGTRAQWMANRAKHGLTKHSPAHVAKITLMARERTSTLNSIEKAREVRAMLGEYSHEQISRVTGVSVAMVDDIARGRAWKDHANPWSGLGA